MTIPEPALPAPQAVVSAFDYDKWHEEEKLRCAAIARNVKTAKTALFDVLEAHGITCVTVEFDGYVLSFTEK